MVIYDKANLEGDLIYETISESVNHTNIDYFDRNYSVPAIFQSQMLVGFADWSASQSNTMLDIEWSQDLGNNRIVIKKAKGDWN
jgi:hypothetical protein